MRNITGAGSVQALGHCVGSVSLMMALAAGLSDVRSAVCMQFTLHPVTSYLNQIKAAAKVDKLMGRIGLSKVAPLTGVTVPNTALDLMLRAVPMPRAERCGKALCRWINAIYTHTHDQLDDATHDQLDDMFGIGGLAALGHMGTMCSGAWRSTARATTYATPSGCGCPSCWCRGRTTSSGRRAARCCAGCRRPTRRRCTSGPCCPATRLGALIGRDAAADVFPVLSEHLDRFNR